MATNDPARDAAREAAEHYLRNLVRLRDELDTDNPDRATITVSLPNGTFIGSVDLPATIVGELGDTAELHADYAEPNLATTLGWDEVTVSPDLTQAVEDALTPALTGTVDGLHLEALADLEDHFASVDPIDLLDAALSANNAEQGLRAFEHLVTGEIDEDGAL
ncbi:hypothetical protein OH810_31945 (plasmid) [Streptomyces albidoflavus]|uniref:hypothetical protein n=1 Tax=Streptomyces albidoflavus TaxID=1886 RepID=UPI002F910DEA|nr:hypothetical protein OH810_31945 [Streptomyces albidoflavus]